ncbi:anthranilate synthase component I [Thermoflavimicrobium dichotomicum]|uniref:Anthranilate synthase component 1 n=1 Tax=Thermoflavimicrobium dichotomicum TaxID=46223 RepID=A0A1I3SJ22_9BACL|nr:anthranilate synthase component I [Thermoflavimicrobium dichotomicum]SFJ58420.1 anthranilate synthase component 1 [Thermoflavimicrobium dichotomicum]
MIYPTYEEVIRLKQDFSMIPICKTIVDDTETPISLFHRFPQAPYSFLFESVEGEQKFARYSFMGTDPFRILIGKDGRYTVMDGKTRLSLQAKDPLDALQWCLSSVRTPRYADYPPFLGGAVGYISYEAIRYFEPVLATSPLKGEGTGAYDIHLMFYDRLLIYDHLKRHIILVKNISIHDQSEQALKAQYQQTIHELESWYQELKKATYQLSILQPSVNPDLKANGTRSNVTKERYIEMVKQAQNHIACGDIFQVVLSQRWTWEQAPSPMTVYRILRQLNPSPYMYYLKLQDETIVGTSPELLVQVNDRMVHTRPIAGSRPRGKNPQEDEALIKDLLQDEKEIAEHVMLVDLGRNDVGRVARYGTVRVTEQMIIEKYSHIMHLVSHVIGELKPECSPLDAVRACFPAGTVSGAPKIRAMEIIAELEPEPRGVYAGAIGYFSFDGNVDTCIAIRTIYFRNGRAYVQAGGGIVADSLPENEYMESVNKAKAMMKALEMARQMEQMGSEQHDSGQIVESIGR